MVDVVIHHALGKIFSYSKDAVSFPHTRCQSETERELYKQTELYKRSCGPISRKSQEEGIRINTKTFERSAILEKFLRSLHLFLKKKKIQALALSDCIEESLVQNHNKHAQNY